MSFFGDYVRSNFSACRHIADARDQHRERDVRIYMMPGEFDHVGVHDGTDSWIAPVIADPFSIDIKRTLQDIREGKPVSKHPKRHKLSVELLATTPTPSRRIRNVLRTDL